MIIGVGKSCLYQRVRKNTFNCNNTSTVGFDYFVFIVKIENKIIKLQLWDTCGEEVYRSLISSFYKSSSLAILVYSIDK